MMRLAVTFLCVALVAALLGFGLVADLSFEAAKILVFVFEFLLLNKITDHFLQIIGSIFGQIAIIILEQI